MLFILDVNVCTSGHLQVVLHASELVIHSGLNYIQHWIKQEPVVSNQFFLFTDKVTFLMRTILITKMIIII
jgi:hypothetical protein